MQRAGRMHDLCALLNPISVDSANPNQAIGYFVAETSAHLHSLLLILSLYLPLVSPSFIDATFPLSTRVRSFHQAMREVEREKE